MLIKWFKFGSGDSTAAFNYLLNERVEQGTAKVLRGSPHITKSITKSLKFKKKYKSGCLSFSESDITAKKQEFIMDMFEKAIFAGLPSENRNICWILHKDKGRIELNFVIPRVELLTSKAFQPYYDKVDRKRFELLQSYINQKFHLTNPNDPNNIQSLNLGDLVKYKKVEHIKHLDTYLQKLVSTKKLTNQEDVIAELKKVGYTINRVGTDYISVKTSKMKPIRLKGKTYSKDWSSKEPEKVPLKSLFNQLQAEIKKARLYNENKYYGGLCLEDDISPKKKNVATHSQKLIKPL